MAALRFPKPEVVLSQPWIEISHRIGMEIDFDLQKWKPSQKAYPEVDFQLYGRHLEKSIWRHNSAADCLLTTKFFSSCQTSAITKAEPGSRFPTLWSFHSYLMTTTLQRSVDYKWCLATATKRPMEYLSSPGRAQTPNVLWCISSRKSKILLLLATRQTSFHTNTDDKLAYH